MYKYYKSGIEKYLAENPEAWTLKVLASATWVEVVEFFEEPSFDELGDIIHGLSSMVFGKRFLYLNWLVANKCARKLAQRYKQNGCIRSARNCAAMCKHK